MGTIASGGRVVAGMMRGVFLALIAAFALAEPAEAEVGTGVTGVVRYYANEDAVPDVSLRLTGVTLIETTTDAGGGFAFADPGAGDWLLTPSKRGDLNGAVAAVDADWELEAAAGVRQLSPEETLACDVTGDGSVSALDAAHTLRFAAGLRQSLAVSEACGSDWAFIPEPAAVANQRLIWPQLAPQCSTGAIAYEPLSPPAAGQGFAAVLFGDCSGDWLPAGAPAATATETAAVTPTATSKTPAATPTRTLSPTNTRVPSATRTPTRTGTATASSTATRTPTKTRTATGTRTPTRTASPTGTATPTRTATATRTPTRTGTGTRTPTSRPTLPPTPTATATCPNGLAWNVSPPLQVSFQSGGNLWLTRAVATSAGWGVFWLRQDPSASTTARLYYAHVDFEGRITAGPLLVTGAPKIAFRDHYYMVAWNQDRYGLLIASNSTLYYYTLSLDGVLSARQTVPVTLFVSTVYDQECDGDLDPYPGGFLGVIEGACSGHSCSYAFKIDVTGKMLAGPVNLVDFDLTHQFYPVSAFDGVGFAILSVKDIKISAGGVMTKYWSSGISSHAKVVPAKEYLWDENPDMAWNGDHFAAIWTENSARQGSAPWQLHFATFRRTKTSSSPIADGVIDVVANKAPYRWTTQVHASGADWVAQYATRAADDSVVAIYELLGDDLKTRAAIEPFALNANALGSAPHFAAGHEGELGIARGAYVAGGTEVTFQTLPPPACAP